MIISSLINYYNRLAQANDPRVAPLGYTWQKIAFAVVLELDGLLFAIEDRRQEIQPRKPKSKPVLKPTSMLVPGQAKPSGPGINPNFLWDQPAYMLGWKPDIAASDKRCLDSNAAFRDRHLALEEEINAPEFSAVCRFLEHWDPGVLSEEQKKVISHFGVFQIRAQHRYVHELPAVKRYWTKQCGPNASDDRPLVPSLVSGEMVRGARLHEPKIKGVLGANTSGAPLVSFNSPAYESYGWEQGDNAPMSDWEAFRYCTALNILTLSQRAYIDDTTLVYWTDTPTAAESFFGMILDREPEDSALREKLRVALDSIVLGRLPGQDFGARGTSFHILGMAGDAGRISVRYWYESTLQEFYSRLKEHFQCLAIDRQYESQPEFPSVRQLLKETVRRAENGQKDEKIRRGLPETLLRSILEGTDYPISIYTALLGRIRIEGRVNYLKASIIKAVLQRNYKRKNTMALDDKIEETGYRLGRLFAVLEQLQDSAIGNAAISGSFGLASTTPGLIFPRLIKGAQPHIRKLRSSGDGGLAHYYTQLIQEIADVLVPSLPFPSRLNLVEQGQFAVGYYQQMQWQFRKKPENEKVIKAENQNESN